MDIVALSPKDWKKYRDLRLFALRDCPHAFVDQSDEVAKYDEKHWRGRLQDVQDGKSWLYFAKQDGNLVGMAGAYQSPDDRARNSATVVGVWIAPEARQRGVASRLMDTLLSSLKNHGGITTARLSVHAGQLAAVRLYEKFGFKNVGEQTATMGDGKRHKEYLMEKVL